MCRQIGNYDYNLPFFLFITWLHGINFFYVACVQKTNRKGY